MDHDPLYYREVHVGWALFNPETGTKVRRSVGYGRHMRQSSKIYASKGVAGRYASPGIIVVPVYVRVPA